MQSILELLQLIYDFLTSDNTVTSSVYMFPVISIRRVNSVSEWLAHSALISLHKIEKRVRFPCSSGPSLLLSLQIRLYVH